MKMSRVGLLAFTLTSVAALASANAADIYAPLWTGPYAGVNGGFGSGSTDSAVDATFAADPKFSTSGGFGGGQIGYNWQRLGGFKDGPGGLVLGIEADIQAAGIDGSASVTQGPGQSATGKNELDWFGTVRGRIGYAMDTTLFYFTGGFAFGGVKDTLSVTQNGTTKTASNDSTDTGYVLGGGVEHYFNPRWSGKIEYQYLDLGSDRFSISKGGASATLDAEHKYNTVRLGLNYHFGAGYEPLK
jgi:outer membrane immunogenic protein